MESKLPEAARLIQEALSGPPGVTELKTESGQPVRVERDPEPGIQLRLVSSGTEEGQDIWMTLSVRAVEHRPGSYPSDIPFLPGVEAIVAMFGETVHVIWQPSRAASPMPDIEPDESLEELERRLTSARKAAAGADPESRAAACVNMRAIIDSLGPDMRGKLEQIWRRMMPEPDVIAQLERTFENATAASMEEGWQLIDRTETDMPIRSLSARFERGADSRRLYMMGLNRSVMLMQCPRKPEAT